LAWRRGKGKERGRWERMGTGVAADKDGEKRKEKGRTTQRWWSRCVVTLLACSSWRRRQRPEKGREAKRYGPREERKWAGRRRKEEGGTGQGERDPKGGVWVFFVFFLFKTFEFKTCFCFEFETKVSTRF
jgi:hypothetical protein